jgi:hypothetical protein
MTFAGAARAAIGRTVRALPAVEPSLARDVTAKIVGSGALLGGLFTS